MRLADKVNRASARPYIVCADPFRGWLRQGWMHRRHPAAPRGAFNVAAPQGTAATNLLRTLSMGNARFFRRLSPWLGVSLRNEGLRWVARWATQSVSRTGRAAPPASSTSPVRYCRARAHASTSMVVGSELRLREGSPICADGTEMNYFGRLAESFQRTAVSSLQGCSHENNMRTVSGNCSPQMEPCCGRFWRITN